MAQETDGGTVCDKQECIELRKELNKNEERLRSQAKESGDPGVDTLTKRVIRSMHDMLSIFETMLASTPIEDGVAPQRLKRLFDEFHLGNYGYSWDTHICPSRSMFESRSTRT